MRRYSDALDISDGACNCSGIARTLVGAIDEARRYGPPGEDHAVKLIVSQLAYLTGIWDGISEFPAYGPSWDQCRAACHQAIALEGPQEVGAL